jgi:hypothetical protein
MVTKDDVLSYQPHHFLDFGDAATQTSSAWSNASLTQHSEAMAMEWQGLAANAYKAVATADHTEVLSAAAHASVAAVVAHVDGQLVWEAQQAARFALEDADTAQVDVSEGFSLSDRLPPSPDPIMRSWRQAEIQYHAGQVGTTVTALIAADTKAAATMRTAGDFSDYHQSPNGHITGVDFKTDKGAPPGGPMITPDPNKQGEKKPRSFGDNVESFTKVVGGAVAIVGGSILTGTSAAATVGTDGVAAPISRPGIATGATAVIGGIGSVEKGLNELFESGQ